MHRAKQGFGAVEFMLTIVILVAAGGIGYYAYAKVKDNNKPSISDSISSTSDDKNDLKTYTSHKYNISFKYPENWTTKTEVTSDDPEWYSSTTRVFNPSGVEVSLLGTGGQFGGDCPSDSEYDAVNVVSSSPVNIKGLGNKYYSETIYHLAGNNRYYLSFGLTDHKLDTGESKKQCANSYDYIIMLADNESLGFLGNLTFGRWFSEQDDTGYEKLDDAKAYLQSSEYKQVKTMIKSLSIGG